MRILILAALVLGCSPTSPRTYDASSSGSSVGSGSAVGSASPAIAVSPEATSSYASRKRPSGTFDVLSPIIQPGDNTQQSINLPANWQVAGPPRMAIDPTTNELSPFVVVSAKLDGSVYVLIAKNMGKKPARLVADVPYR